MSQCEEHGVLNRCLLIYEEAIRRIESKGEVSPEVFHHTAGLIRHFVEDYHERNEEKYIFPHFIKAKKEVGLVQTLLAQHQGGRRLTADILRLSQPGLYRSKENQKLVVAACRNFIRMYRPHEAREDTVLFPALRKILTPRQVLLLGEQMEEDEQKVLGHEGFEIAVAQVTDLEKSLGIYDLGQFTPH